MLRRHRQIICLGGQVMTYLRCVIIRLGNIATTAGFTGFRWLSTDTRTEYDTFGPLEVPNDKYISLPFLAYNAALLRFSTPLSKMLFPQNISGMSMLTCRISIRQTLHFTDGGFL